MIMALKEHGFRVIMDVVYNHTYLSKNSHLNKLVPGYYYRQDAHGNFTNGSGCGNELATERFMVRKMIIDSVCFWAEEYKIDGFRFDLMGLFDIPTINEIRSRLNAIDPSIIMFEVVGGHTRCRLSQGSGVCTAAVGTGCSTTISDTIKAMCFLLTKRALLAAPPAWRKA